MKVHGLIAFCLFALSSQAWSKSPEPSRQGKDKSQAILAEIDDPAKIAKDSDDEVNRLVTLAEQVEFSEPEGANLGDRKTYVERLNHEALRRKEVFARIKKRLADVVGKRLRHEVRAQD